MLKLKFTCSECGKTFIVRVREEDYQNYQRGEDIRECFPYLSADQRELFISGICGKCFDEIFQDEDE